LTSYPRIRVRSGRLSTPVAEGRRARRAPPAPHLRKPAAENLVGMIDACIEDVRQAGFAQTADMLAIARLDLLANLHGIGDEEFDDLLASAAGIAGRQAE
jgi:hypothetical protein